MGLSSICYNKWITREELVERGFEKMVNEYDGKMAAEQKVRPGLCVGDPRLVLNHGISLKTRRNLQSRGLQAYPCAALGYRATAGG